MSRIIPQKAKVLVIHGAARLAHIIADFVKTQYDCIYSYHDFPQAAHVPDHLSTSTDFPVISCIEALSVLPAVSYISSIGYKNMEQRMNAYNKMIDLEFIDPVNVVFPSTYISPGASMGKGNIVLPGVTIEDGASIGDNNIIWSNTCICHDSIIGSHCFIAASTTIGGNCHVGDSIFFGFGTIVNDHLSVASNSFTASGSVVTKPISVPGTRVCGVPAKPMPNALNLSKPN